MAAALDPNLIGLIVSGDLGRLTIYTSKRLKKVWFPITDPPNPPTDLQVWTRQKFSNASKLYRCLSDDERSQLKRCCKKLALVCTGPALWTCLCFRPDETFRQTLQRQSGISLPNPLTVVIQGSRG